MSSADLMLGQPRGHPAADENFVETPIAWRHISQRLELKLGMELMSASGQKQTCDFQYSMSGLG